MNNALVHGIVGRHLSHRGRFIYGFADLRGLRATEYAWPFALPAGPR